MPFPPPPVSQPPERPAAPPPVVDEVPVLDTEFEFPADLEGDVAEVDEGLKRIVVEDDPKPKRGGGRRKK